MVGTMANPPRALAQITRSSKGIEGALTDFFASPIGGVIDSILDVVAIGLALFGLWMIAKAVKSSNPGAEIAKKGLWPFVAATLVFELDWTTRLVGLISKAITVIFDSVVRVIPGLG
ncbi:MAG: hypothetical protein F4Z31_02110 [Gemmatimonadetes bacterium]|nr:hypothetical protein [Gemmatimonadota bacterium]